MIGRNWQSGKYHIEKGQESRKMESLTYVMCMGGGGRRGVGKWRGMYGKHMGRVGIDKGR